MLYSLVAQVPFHDAQRGPRGGLLSRDFAIVLEPPIMYLLVLNAGPRDWESSNLTTRPYLLTPW